MEYGIGKIQWTKSLKRSCGDFWKDTVFGRKQSMNGKKNTGKNFLKIY